MTDTDGIPPSAPPPQKPKRRYTVTPKVLAARRANLEKALAIPKEIRLRNTPAREQARRRNLEKAWAKQRDPNQIPGCRFKHGAYSRDLRRTAPLAGEQSADLDRLLDRLLALFPLPRPHFADGLRRAAEHIWRVRRVLGSRVHQERLAFYQALFEAAETPGGLGLERVQLLAERLAEALDLRDEERAAFVSEVQAQQKGLQRVLDAWEEDMRRELVGESPRLSGGNAGGGLGLTQPPPWGPVQWGEWLAREFAKRNWKLAGDQGNEGPEDDLQGDDRLHGWLVRAAVVGGDNVTARFSPALEDAIERLASETLRRLSSVRYDFEQAVEDCEWQVADLEKTRKSAAEHLEDFENMKDEDLDEEEREERSWPPAMRRWVAELDGKNAATMGMHQVAGPWLDLDATRVADDVGSSNANVQEAMLGVVTAMMQEPCPSGASN